MTESNAPKGAWSKLAERAALLTEELRPLATTPHLSLLCLMAGEPSMSLAVLASHTGLSQVRLRAALTELEAQGLVARDGQGGSTRYALADRRRERLLFTLRVLYLDD